MAATLEILVSSPMFGYYSSQAVARLEARGCVLTRRPDVADEAGLTELVRDADAWIIGLQRVTEATLRESKRLRAVAIHGVGVDHVDVAAATRLIIPVVNTPGANANAVAEMAIAFILVLSREVLHADEIVRRGGWAPTMVGEEICDKTLGVVGFGAIGRRVAALGRGLGMRVLAYSRSAVTGEPESGISFVTLDELLRQSDYVSIHLALTDATRRMIGERELGLMKPAACLVNTARGAIVDEAALHRMLTSGHLRGAALDVFSEEPPQSNPLVGLAQVIASPHLGGNTVQGFSRTSDAVTDSLLLLLDGAPPTRLVNPEVWPAYVKRWGR
jgi:D-3-phosphoglycerate dehydrogenase / 2-oxoglutarate reductase